MVGPNLHGLKQKKIRCDVKVRWLDESTSCGLHEVMISCYTQQSTICSYVKFENNDKSSCSKK